MTLISGSITRFSSSFSSSYVCCGTVGYQKLFICSMAATMTDFRGRQANQIHRKWSLLHLAVMAAGANAFSTPFIQRSVRPFSPSGPPTKKTSLPKIDDEGVMTNNVVGQLPKQASAILSSIAALAILAAPLNVAVPGAAWADEWGKETEAPTIFTGETVMVSSSCYHCFGTSFGKPWLFLRTYDVKILLSYSEEPFIQKISFKTHYF